MKNEDKDRLEQYFRDDPYWIEQAREMYIDKVFDGSTATQNVHTPSKLCSEVVGKLKENCIISGKKILTLNPEFITVLGNEDITFISDCPKKSRYIKGFYPNVKVIEGNFLEMEMNMKFDVVVMNPPYRASQDKIHENGRLGKNNALWDKFVIKSLGLLSSGGYLCAIHPSRWRKPTDKLWAIMRQKQMHYIEIHNKEDGLKTFGCDTRYDWYVMENIPSYKKTTVMDEVGKIHSLDIKSTPFLPNFMIDEILPLISTEESKRIKILSTCDYHSQKVDLMKKQRDATYKYPCVWSISKDGDAKFWYSKKNTLGHFGIPKLIFASGRVSSANYIIDSKGEYGLTQYAKAIIDIPENLKKIYQAMMSDKFKNIMDACSVSFHEIDKDILCLFRHDFWKEFI